ncbi:phosphatase PAP2 family protein [Terriglobus albidus]|uniref:Phosphatase PAP2 family protein n=1 Tax=Terriglobus albidus TaxID=1592106 RepID=A0A5B9E2P1_9BACT|nr:phosphatase PAP2 family protein [Terriglobus albidus]QEE26573.1 phosphatase PAP2 family protein [Terriglobus albidus]
MRISEWIQAGFASIFAVAAWVYPLAARRRLIITSLAAGAIFVIALARLSVYILAPVQVSILRDWLPAVLMLIPYWQTGQFFLGPNEKIQAWLMQSDRRLWNFASHSGWTLGRFAHLSMEWAYMLCYPLPLLGLATLYAAGLSREADSFWAFVLLPTYLCYAITPFVPAMPPRFLESEHKESQATKSKIFNLWIQKHGSIHAISFPSAHVAASLAISLFLLHRVLAAGIFFLVISLWIAVAAVVERYHYAVDVLLGAVLALAMYLAWLAHLIPSTLITAPATAFVTPL